MEESSEKVWVRVARADVRCSLAQPFACLADHSASVDFDPERPLLRLRSSLSCVVEDRGRGILVARCMWCRVVGAVVVCVGAGGPRCVGVVRNLLENRNGSF